MPWQFCNGLRWALCIFGRDTHFCFETVLLHASWACT